MSDKTECAFYGRCNDPLDMRGIELTGDHFAECNLLLSIIDEDNRVMAKQ